MAKKRKSKDEEDETDFKLPKFDEEKFLKKERRNIKTIFISFFFGLLMGAISFGFWALLKDSGGMRWPLVFLVGFAYIPFIRYFFLKLNIDLTDFGKKGWFMSVAIYFFAWLLVLMVLVNPPFYDDEAPMLDVVCLPEYQEPGGDVKIVARILDNAEVENIDFVITGPTEMEHTITNYSYEDGFFTYSYSSPDNLTEDQTYGYKITATDVNGHISEETGTFTFSDRTIKLPEPTGAEEVPGPAVTYTTDIKFDVKPSISRFYYTVDGGDEINVTKDGDYYTTSPKIKGWIPGAEVEINAYAKIIYYFDNCQTQFNNTIADSSTYYFNVSDIPEIGGEDPPKITLPQPTAVRVPGFESVIFVISLLAVILIFKYKKKDRRS